jgi:hypothetical protein
MQRLFDDPYVFHAVEFCFCVGTDSVSAAAPIFVNEYMHNFTPKF